MLKESQAYSGFAVDDAEAAKRFYGEVLGLGITEIDAQHGLLQLDLAGGRSVLIYTKPDHEPAGFTILNFPVEDVEAKVDELTAAGVEFERYPGAETETDEKGIFRGGGPLIAWFKDPAGNVLSVIAG